MVLPTTYLGSAEWYKLYFTNPTEVAIEVMESFPKQTYRNRSIITTPDGPLMLSVPVKRADSKQLTRDVEISYQQRWQHQHWIALVSAYKRTPYFDYYADFFRPFYERKTKYLIDLNDGLHQVITQLIHNSEVKPSTAKFTTDWQGLNLETSLGNGQSILDLLFEYGPETVLFLK
jgi:hypothetical protein